MTPETKNHRQGATSCQNCKSDFTIESDDFAFYEKIKVPAPTWCPECRFVRRISFLNWTVLYKRKCDKCKKDTISVHHDKKPFKVLCNDCWFSDDWDGTEYAMDYDPNRNFFEQMIELRNKSSFMALENLHTSLVNSPYVNATAYLKNCFMLFNADYGEDSAYCLLIVHIKQCLDCYRIKSSELCYESTGIHKCYKCIYSEELDSCTNVYFSRACSGCTDCFGCVNLRNKSYCIFNKQYSKEEYKEKIKSFKLNTRDGIKKALKDSYKFWLEHPHRSVTGNSLNINTTGDFVYESKNTHEAYLVSGAEDCKYVQLLNSSSSKNCYDYTNWGMGAENLYDCATVGEGAFNNKFCVQCWPNAMNTEYCLYALQPKDCFGCVNLKRKKYCILNKQYSKEGYEKLKKQILKDMDKNPYVDKLGRIWKYGEQLPLDISPFAYNETVAQDFFPLTKEKALEKNVNWFGDNQKNYKVTVGKEKIPQTSAELTEDVLKEVLECDTCDDAFNINKIEFMILKKVDMPCPTSCWKCRYKRRFNRVNKGKLYARKCTKCNCEIKTSYEPNRPEIIYCESCYQQELV